LAIGAGLFSRPPALPLFAAAAPNTGDNSAGAFHCGWQRARLARFAPKDRLKLYDFAA
jgi:hypothetical protein